MAYPNTKPPLEQFEQIANVCGGILSDIAANFKVARNTVYAWCNDDPEFKQALEDSRERFVDLAESNSVNLWLVFLLSRKTRTGKSDLQVGSNDHPKQQSSSPSKHEERNGDI